MRDESTTLYGARCGLRITCILGVLSTPAAAQLDPATEEAVPRGLVYEMAQYPPLFGYSGFGCGFADLDEDGDLDSILMGAASGIVGIFENDGTGNFTQREKTGMPILTEASGWSAADYDGDGDLDVYVTQIEETNYLMRNDGDFTFANVTNVANVGHPGETMSASWGDYDNDGWLDLYVTNYTNADPTTPSFNNELYHNLGDGTFEAVGAALGVDGHGFGFQAVWTDYDIDGDVDVYVSNDRGHLPPNFRSNQLWRNDGGTFVNVSESSGAGVALFSMGLASGDFDGNGYPDIYVTNISSYSEGFNPLLLNQGDGTFIEYSAEAGVDQWITSWGAIFFDFDNDSHMDLYVNNMFEANSLLQWPEAFPCQNFGAAAEVEGNPGVSYGSAVGDVDGDGDLDLVCNNLSHNVELFINHEGEDRDWARFVVVGEGMNLYAVGASVRALIDGQSRFAEVLAGGNGYKGQNEFTIHYGLDDSTVDELLVMWPGGATRTLAGLAPNTVWTLYPASRLGDVDGDGLHTADDFWALAACYGGPVQPGCEMMDYDGDTDVDADDAAAFVGDYDDPILDCDANGAADMLQILASPGLDANGSGVLDACEAAGDVNGDAGVDVEDLLIVILNWGDCPVEDPCMGDTNGDGSVDVTDLVAVMTNWG